MNFLTASSIGHAFKINRVIYWIRIVQRSPHDKQKIHRRFFTLFRFQTKLFEVNARALSFQQNWSAAATKFCLKGTMQHYLIQIFSADSPLRSNLQADTNRRRTVRTKSCGMLTRTDSLMLHRSGYLYSWRFTADMGYGPLILSFAGNLRLLVRVSFKMFEHS